MSKWKIDQNDNFFDTDLVVQNQGSSVQMVILLII